MATVIVEPLRDQTAEDLGRQMWAAFERLGIPQAFRAARGIFIKPNLTYPRYREGVTTQVGFVEALVAQLRRISDAPQIIIGEGEGGYHSFSMSQAMEEMGFQRIAATYPNTSIVNLSYSPTRTVELRAKGKPYPLALPSLFFDQVDWSISCPVPKVHCMTRLTLSLKNQWGCLPDLMRLKNHYVFDEIIAQVCEVLKFRYAFLDGRYGLDRNGPMVGDPVRLNWFAAGDSLGAFDRVIASMMGIPWRRVGHLRWAHRQGIVPEESQIEVLGDPQRLARRFRLRRTFWNYPALVAFHSRRLTELVYLSRYADALHRLMYLIRKKPIAES